jgi:mono/diheme cytochrome c family protein
MLRGIDKGLAIVSWLAAAALVLMLFVGPEVVAEDEPQGGKTVFTANCGSCHTLSRAGTSGVAGPKLDSITLDPAQVEEIVRNGKGSMPSFEGTLSDAEIAEVARYVAGPNYSAPPN